MPRKSLVDTLMTVPLFDAQWVLWLLFAVSVISVAVMIERGLFYRRSAVDALALQDKLRRLLAAGDFEAASSLLRRSDSLECNVVLRGLLEYRRGPEAVEDVLDGAEATERLRYSRRLSLLATIGSNAPFVGLFGTVLGIIRAFHDLSTDFGSASGTVMAGVSEALVATAVGLVVAIPALVAYNAFTRLVRVRVGNGLLLRKTLLAQLKSDALDDVDARGAASPIACDGEVLSASAVSVESLQRAEV